MLHGDVQNENVLGFCDPVDATVAMTPADADGEADGDADGTVMADAGRSACCIRGGAGGGWSVGVGVLTAACVRVRARVRACALAAPRGGPAVASMEYV